MTWKAFDYGTDYSISTADSTDTITVTVNGTDVDLTQQLDFGVNKTPDDPIAEAELILSGICPKCRCETPEHDWNCPDWSANSVGFDPSQNVTIGTTYGPTITLDSTIHVGNNTLTQEKLDKLDALLDRVDDLDIDKLIKFVDKLPDE